jgi:hypothetical protein
MTDDCAEFQTQSSLRRQQGIAVCFRAHRPIAQDEMREDREHRATCGALETPDGDATETDTEIMRVPRQASSSATGRLMFQLKAKGQEKGEDTFEKCRAISRES